MGLFIGAGTGVGIQSGQEELITFAAECPDVVASEVGQKGFLPAAINRPSLNFIATQKTGSIMDWEQLQKGVFTGVKNMKEPFKVDSVFNETLIRNKTFIATVNGLGSATEVNRAFFLGNGGYPNAFIRIFRADDTFFFYYKGNVKTFALPFVGDLATVGISFDGNGVGTCYVQGKNKGSISAGEGSETPVFLNIFSAAGGEINKNAVGIMFMGFNFGMTDIEHEQINNGCVPWKYQLDKTYYENYIPDAANMQRSESAIYNAEENSYNIVSNSGSLAIVEFGASGIGYNTIEFDYKGNGSALYVAYMKTGVGYVADNDSRITLDYPTDDYVHVQYVLPTQYDPLKHQGIAIVRSGDGNWDVRNIKINAHRVTHEIHPYNMQSHKLIDSTGKNHIPIVSNDGISKANVTTAKPYNKYNSGNDAPKIAALSTEQVYDDVVNGKRYEVVQLSDGSLVWKLTTL